MSETKTIAEAEIPYKQNRELSWLKFNDRVLDEAMDPTVPALERLRPDGAYEKIIGTPYDSQAEQMVLAAEQAARPEKQASENKAVYPQKRNHADSGSRKRGLFRRLFGKN